MSDSVAAAGYQRVEVSKLRPAKIGSQAAIRFDLAAKTESGLEIAGTAEAAVMDGKLYTVLFLAPAEHYYPTTLPAVEAALGKLS